MSTRVIICRVSLAVPLNCVGYAGVHVDLADGVVASIRNEDVAIFVACHPARLVERGLVFEAILQFGLTCARHRAHDTLLAKGTNVLVAIVGNDDVARLGTHSNALREREHGRQRRAITIPFLAIACQCLGYTFGRKDADAMVAIVCHVHISFLVRGDATRVIKHGLRAGAVFEALFASPGKCGHHALDAHLADAVVAAINYENVAELVARHARRAVEFGVSRGAIREALLKASCHCRDSSILGVYLANCMVLLIGDDKVAFGVNRETRRAVEHRVVGVGVQPPVAAKAARIRDEVAVHVCIVQGDNAVVTAIGHENGAL
mmetsp:Transcript_63936/g.103352  ORF Transcript_63936/g.103352 Transcript_63936/m.103352 type:complete len:320 (+) Transcript_63936:390-1349(+)